MRDYHFHCFQASWETKPFIKPLLPGHSASHTLALSTASSKWPRRPFHDNDTTVGERGHHFLDGCGQCGRHLDRNKDIFMYRGDTPFCNEECRQQEMDAEKAKERRISSKQGAAAKSAATKRGRKQQRRPPVTRRRSRSGHCRSCREYARRRLTTQDTGTRATTSTHA